MTALRRLRACVSLACVAAATSVASPARAATVTASPGDDVESIINGLAPGDELVLADGMYLLDDSRFGIDVTGTAVLPIVIRAADGARPHFHRPNQSQNIWEITAAHVVIRGLEFSGGSAGLRVQAARDLTIEDCAIHDTGDVGLRVNDPGTHERLRILRNEIYRTDGTGEGMYLGCNSDGCRIASSLIEGNYVHHTNGPSVEQGDGIELKEGSYGNVIRDNVIHDTNYPCILAYGTVGNGAQNVIERNVVWRCGDNGIQVAADAIIRNNIVLGAANDGIAMQPIQAGTPSDLVAIHNTVLNAGRAMALRGATGAVLIANNALYSRDGEALFTNGDTSRLTSVGNVGAGGGMGVSPGGLATDLVMGSHAGEPPMNVFPAAGGALLGAGEAAHVAEDDFDGVPRLGVADVGAYAFASGGPRWALAPERKVIGSGPPPGEDGGTVVPGDDAGITPPPRDGGAPPGGDAGGPTGGGGDGGCGCVTAGGRPSAPGGAAGLALVLVALLAGRQSPSARRSRAPSRSGGHQK